MTLDLAIHYLIRLLAVLAFLLTMADCWSTNNAIAAGGREANPVMAFFMRLLGPKWVIPRLLFGQVNIAVVLYTPGTAETWKGALSLGINVAVLIFVLWNNLKVTAKLKAARA